jgi:trehalose 6-phosphate phosphatase
MAACRHALFLDFDGTLVDLAPSPDAVRVEPGLGEAMETVSRMLGGAFAIVTGRSIAVLDAFLAPLRFDVAGLHGAELRVGGHTVPALPPPAHFRLEVARLAAAAGGLVVEDKGTTVALHWRLAPALRGHAEALAAQALERLGEGWRLQTGKAVVEILPADAGKDRAIAALLGREPFRGRIPVFVGDDDTDERGFAEVIAAGGLAIRVGEGPSLAPVRLAGPTDLRRGLVQWARSGECPFEAGLPRPHLNEETRP